MPDWIAEFITKVGFPIVMSFGLFWMCMKQLREMQIQLLELKGMVKALYEVFVNIAHDLRHRGDEA